MQSSDTETARIQKRDGGTSQNTDREIEEIARIQSRDRWTSQNTARDRGTTCSR